MDDVQAKLAEITALVDQARSMPMSASCVVNRSDLLTMLAELDALLPEAFDEAQEVLTDRAGVVEDGRREAEAIIARAQEERRRMLQADQVHAVARAEADLLLEQARGTADAMRLEVEDYVDAKLANFEIVLGKTLAAVERGRHKLAGRHELDDLADSPLPAGASLADRASLVDDPLPG